MDLQSIFHADSLSKNFSTNTTTSQINILRKTVPKHFERCTDALENAVNKNA